MIDDRRATGLTRLRSDAANELVSAWDVHPGRAGAGGSVMMAAMSQQGHYSAVYDVEQSEFRRKDLASVRAVV